MRLGLVARADNSGLGIQTHEFYRHMKPERTLVVDIGKLNGNRSYPERYPDAKVISGFPNDGDLVEFLAGLQVVFVAESPYNYRLYSLAKQLGVKVAVQYNYEFFDWFAYPHYPKPDMLIAPSKWGFEKVDQFAQREGIKHIYLHCPVNREMLPMRHVPRFKTFLHMAGRAAAHDRNGTKTVIEAAAYLKSDAVIKIHFQGEQGLGHQATHTTLDYINMLPDDPPENLRIMEYEYDNYWEAYEGADVLVLPRRYGGNCLPMNEALSLGMPVLMPDISPNNQFLPPQWLVPAKKIGEFKPRMVVNIYEADARALAEKIDRMAGYRDGMVQFEQLTADNLAKSISWAALAREYETALRGLL